MGRPVKVFHDAPSAGRALHRPVVTVGNFDGVHRGHRLILARTRERAAAASSPALAVTFRPHPASVLSDAGAPRRLCSDAQQRELLEACGADGLLLQRFDLAFARRGPEEFYAEFLRGALDCRGIVVGANFRFGAHRRGDVGLLAELASADTRGPVAVDAVPPLEVDGEPVSSSRIRRLVAGGDVAAAADLLGRPFSLDGRVVKGDGRGRELGFPTANVEPAEVMRPGPGVYACVLRRDADLLGAVTNVGRRPTFGAGGMVVEAHVLDFDGTLYGERVRLAFLERIRDERRFAGAEELVAQLRRDRDAARAVLNGVAWSALADEPGT